MATTKYQPRPLQLPQGQSPGSGAEVVRRSRKTNSLAEALLRGGGGGGGGRRFSLADKVNVGVNIKLGGDKGRDEERAYQKQREEDARDFQREIIADRREYDAERDETQRRNAIRATEVAGLAGKLNTIETSRIQEINRREAEANQYRARIIAGHSSAIAVARERGISLNQLLEETNEAMHQERHIWDEDLTSDIDATRRALMRHLELGTKPQTMTMEPGEEEFPSELPKLPSRIMDYNRNHFLETLHGDLMFMDTSSSLSQRDIREGTAKLVIAGQKVREEGLQRFEATLRSSGLHDEVARKPRAEKMLRDIQDLVAESIRDEKPVDQEAINRVISQANQNPDAQDLLEKTLNGQRLAISEDMASATLGAIVYGHDEVLKLATEYSRDTKLQEELKGRMSYWFPGGDEDRLRDANEKVREVLTSARGNVASLEGHSFVSEYLGDKRGELNMLESYRIRSDALLKGLEAGADLGGLIGAYQTERGETTDELIAELGRLRSEDSPFYQIIGGANNLSPRAMAILRTSLPILDKTTPPPTNAAPGPLQTQSIGPPTAPSPSTPRQTGLDVAASPTSQTTLDSLIRP